MNEWIMEIYGEVGGVIQRSYIPIILQNYG